MKVLVVNTMAPFVWGGAEELAVHLQKNLRAAGHEAEVLRIPFQWEPATRIPSQMLMVRALELWNVDRVIALKFPAYLIRHPHKTLWLLHQYRQAYDLYDAGQSNLPAGEQGAEVRRIIKNGDEESFAECRRIFANSEVTCRRLAYHNGVEAEALPPPLNDPQLFAGGAPEGYVFAGGRINSMKRQHLLLEALAVAPGSIRLVVAGPPDAPEDAARLRRLVETLGLGDRVTLDLRFLPRSELARYVNHASAVACLPYDEDSLSYVAMEAAAAGKALISTHDSGGVLGLARHLQTGWVADPTPASLAEALTQAFVNAAFTEQLGLAARGLWTDMEITWPKTIERLLS
jgi:glycosyltransferase involved in cell wall biosynthesis